MATRLQVVITDPEAKLFNKWCKARGYIKDNGKPNYSLALAFLIRREIDQEQGT